MLYCSASILDLSNAVMMISKHDDRYKKNTHTHRCVTLHSESEIQ